ncbi:MAG: hypothetical protein QG599_3497 [Pseudomonadota bacterium]|nr:hypothetical protein [Pseudomonadota bacterium]
MAYSNQPESIKTLGDALRGQWIGRLKTLAALAGEVPDKLEREANLIAFIQRCLNGPPDQSGKVENDPLPGFWRRLDPLQQAAVAEIAHGPVPYFDAYWFAAKYGQLPDWGGDSRFGSGDPPSLLSLFFHEKVMPEDLRRRFRAFVPKPSPVELPSHREIPGEWPVERFVQDETTRRRQKVKQTAAIVQRRTDREALHDLKVLLRLIDAGKLVVSDKTHQPGSAMLRTLDGLLLGGDFYDDSDYSEDEKIGAIKPFAWPMLVQAGGLTALSGKTLQLSKAGQKALTDPAENTIAHLWRRWLKTTVLDELRRVDVIKGQTGKGKRGLTSVAPRRAAIDQALTRCPLEQWVGIDDLFRQMRANRADFEVTRDPDTLSIYYPNYTVGDYHDPWKIFQARYTLCLLFEYAATLGLIDVAYIPPHGARQDHREMYGISDLPLISRYDGLLFIRVNALGAYCLGRADRYEPAILEFSVAVAPRVRVLPNLEITAIGEPLEPADVMLLNSYASQTADKVWKLDQARLLEALEEGHDLTVLGELLASLSGQPLPETVERFLADMTARARSLKVQGPALLVQCEDTVLATLIANDSRTKPFCLLAGERHLAVFAECEARFRSALRKLGYSLPK